MKIIYYLPYKPSKENDRNIYKRVLNHLVYINFGCLRGLSDNYIFRGIFYASPNETGQFVLKN